MPRTRHPNKEIEAAVAYAESKGFRWVRKGSHAWGIFHCPGGRGACVLRVYSTPRVPEHHANFIRRTVDGCPH